ncbi:unnamed protein product [Onchocerca flexuosa]|uniref:Uncharacterized protein n=1 Tax=Onchocerca flexuosa TaxID=387005 RepID=A0A3P7WVW3_9BILA|nr:unnamed protein product [Onchocerca flexuosa]
MQKFLRAVAADNLTENDLYVLSSRYIEEIFDFYKNSQRKRGEFVEWLTHKLSVENFLKKFVFTAARTFEAHYLSNGMQEDQWTVNSAILFAATTVIPVGMNNNILTVKITKFKNQKS